MTATAAHGNGSGGGCVFCAIAAGLAPAQTVARWPDALAIVPLSPVTDGHLLVLPTSHVPDAVFDPDVTAATMRRAAELAQGAGPANLITSIGPAATQSVEHLHIHLVPRRAHDGLHLPWTVPAPVVAEAQTTSDDPTGAWL
ncbi:HIT family protein [Kitasatospora sp. NPDC127067]|uniref:HIT family protein n=1 Tax=Kitasatospora sp. NPDC127067 TaxID=3347126 RepID=UPI003661ABAA